jgi:beta-barrel assembly-enhancing protease
MPALTKDDWGWTGVVYADGQRISVSPATVVCLKPNHAERMSLRNDGQSETMKFTPDSLNLDTFVHYEGTRESDGSVRAEKIEFQHAEVEKSEVILWRRYYPRVREPDYDAFRSGELRMHWKNYKIVPNREAQEYIAQLGNSLIPAHQKSLADGDPLKIPFRFFLVEDKSFNAVTYPNGVVVVHSGVFDVLENEAQLAFVLSHEISHAVEKHAWQQNEYYKTERIALRVAGGAAPEGLLVGNLLASGISSQYSRSLESQADRVGLEWMLEAGYDIRQAPESWQAVSKAKGDSPANPFWASHDNATTRRSYLMSELRNNYSGLDYSKLREDSDEFHRVADLVKQFENAKKTKRVKTGE